MKSYKYLKHKKKDFLNAFNVSKKIISIPVSSHLTKKNLRFITNSIQADEYKHIKKLIMGFIVAGVLGGAFITKMTSDNYAKKDAILQEQAKVMAEIAVAIKDNIKGK